MARSRARPGLVGNTLLSLSKTFDRWRVRRILRRNVDLIFVPRAWYPRLHESRRVGNPAVLWDFVAFPGQVVTIEADQFQQQARYFLVLESTSLGFFLRPFQVGHTPSNLPRQSNELLRLEDKRNFVVLPYTTRDSKEGRRVVHLFGRCEVARKSPLKYREAPNDVMPLYDPLWAGASPCRECEEAWETGDHLRGLGFDRERPLREWRETMGG
jgi:hypothetical protein